MLPKYRTLLEYDLSILVFSGDVDAIVPVSSLTAINRHILAGIMPHTPCGHVLMHSSNTWCGNLNLRCWLRRVHLVKLLLPPTPL